MFFQNANYAQMAWYQVQLNLDEEEEFELLRYMAEYNAMFTNPEGVKKARDAREKSIAIPDDQFEGTIKELFGKELTKEIKDFDPESLFKNKNEDKISQYLDMELDEVKFIPCKGD